jgi:hypothetical protein
MGNRPLTYDHLRSAKKPQVEKCRIWLDPDVADEYEEAQKELNLVEIKVKASPGDLDLVTELDAAKAAYQKAEAKAERSSAVFKFRSIGRKHYDQLVRENPPTDAQKKEVAEAGEDPDQLPWNPETFIPQLVAASMIEPKLVHEEIMEMWDSENWSAIELGVLFEAALRANNTRKITQVGNV